MGLTPEAKKLARLDVREPCPLGGSRGIFPQKIWKFYICKDVVSYILNLQTMPFNYRKKITFLQNLIMI